MSLATATIVGRLTRDPELKTGATTTVAKFTLAVDGRKRDDPASFLDCRAFGKLAEIIGQYATKGSSMAVGCTVRQERWEAKDGSKRSAVIFVVENMRLLGGRSEQSEPQPDQRRAAPPAAVGEDDEPPF